MVHYSVMQLEILHHHLHGTTMEKESLLPRKLAEIYCTLCVMLYVLAMPYTVGCQNWVDSHPRLRSYLVNGRPCGVMEFLESESNCLRLHKHYPGHCVLGQESHPRGSSKTLINTYSETRKAWTVRTCCCSLAYWLVQTEIKRCQTSHLSHINFVEACHNRHFFVMIYL